MGQNQFRGICIESRYKRSKPKRDQLQTELEKVARGDTPDWQALDQKARYCRRLERLGMFFARSNDDTINEVARHDHLPGVERSGFRSMIYPQPAYPVT